jgi:hypothetical protein
MKGAVDVGHVVEETHLMSTINRVTVLGSGVPLRAS